MMLETQVDRAIHNAMQHKSLLDQSVLNIEGMSSPKVKHFLNNVVNFPTCRYLEVGSWKGSTFIAALFNNTHYDRAWSIENWSEFGGPREEFYLNLNSHLSKDNRYDVVEGNFEYVPLLQYGIQDINCYFYDGAHDAESQKKALTKMYPALTEQFIFIVDDWNHEPARLGTYEGIEALGLKIISKWEMPANYNGDRDNWWNGLGIFVLDKSDE